MSLEEFTTCYQTKNGREIYQFIEKNRENLLEIDSDDLYGVILKSNLHENVKYFAESKYPWKELAWKHNRLRWDDVQLQQDDLSETRMFECKSVVLYTKILQNFLQNHEIEDIPQSFLELELTNVLEIFETLSHQIIDEDNVFRNILTKNTTVNKKYLHLLCYYFERYFDDFMSNNSHPKKCCCNECQEDQVDHQSTQEKICSDIQEMLHSRFDKHEDQYIDYYKSVMVNETNLIEVFFDMVKNDTGQIYEDFSNVSNYFEWMSLDQQLTFWDLVTSNDELYKVVDITVMSKSALFINFAFDHIPNCYESICDRIDANFGTITLSFWKLFIKKYPDAKNYVYTYMILSFNCFEYMYIFEDVSVQEMLKVMKDILL